MKLYVLEKIGTTDIQYFRLLTNLCETNGLNYTNVNYAIHRKNLGIWSDTTFKITLSQTID